MLEWTGERFIPGEGGTDIRYEHTHRYSLVAPTVRGKRVLDVGSGEGYGTATLASQAAATVGVDIDAAAIAHAQEAHARVANLEYLKVEPGPLPFDDDEFDCVVCFEVIEHLSEPQNLLPELARVLKADGTLFISTPNKHLYSDVREYVNEYHLREFYMDEFRDFLKSEFRSVTFFGQRLLATSFIWSLGDSLSHLEFRATPEIALGGGTKNDPEIEPMYVVAACSQEEPIALPSSILVTPDDALTREMDGSIPYTRVRQLLDDMDEERARAQAVLDNWEAELNTRAAALAEAAVERTQLQERIAELEAMSQATSASDTRRKWRRR